MLGDASSAHVCGENRDGGRVPHGLRAPPVPDGAAPAEPSPPMRDRDREKISRLRNEYSPDLTSTATAADDLHDLMHLAYSTPE